MLKLKYLEKSGNWGGAMGGFSGGEIQCRWREREREMGEEGLSGGR